MNRILAFFFLIIFSPLLILISIIIIIDSDGPVLIWSQRVGLHSKIFLMPKFRTMHIGTPNLPTNELNNPDKYITFFGKILRKFSIDEIPQLYSIIKGDMNFVGPRPALFNQYNLIELRKKFNVDSILPGITGFAQINGRDKLCDQEKVDYDLYYLLNKNFFFDLKICIFTIFKYNIKNISH